MHWLDKIYTKYNMTQYELAKRSGVSQQRLSKYRLNNVPIYKLDLLAILEIANTINEPIALFIANYG